MGVQNDGGWMFIAGMTSVQEPPLNDLWTIPGEGKLLAQWQEEDRQLFTSIDPISHYFALQHEDFLTAIQQGRSPAVTAVGSCRWGGKCSTVFFFFPRRA